MKTSIRIEKIGNGFLLTEDKGLGIEQNAFLSPVEMLDYVAGYFGEFDIEIKKPTDSGEGK